MILVSQSLSKTDNNGILNKETAFSQLSLQMNKLVDQDYAMLVEYIQNNDFKSVWQHMKQQMDQLKECIHQLEIRY